MDSIDDNRGPQINAVAITMLVLATVAVALRFWARYIAQKAGYWWDDWLALAALPFIWTSCALSFYWVSIGLGRHISRAPGPPSQLAKILFVENLIYNSGLTLVKMSVLLFYTRLFSNDRAYRTAFWITGALIVGWWVAIDLLAIFSCVPPKKSWLPMTPGHCLSSHNGQLGATIPNVIIDVLLLVLPIPMLWRLHISTGRKMGLVGVFTAGYCVVILSILRLISIVQLGDSLTKDFSWNIAYPQILVLCEVPVALISCCLPSIFNLAKHGARTYLPGFASILGVSRQLSGPEGTRIGPIANPIEERREKGFVPLSDDIKHPGSSDERLFQKTTPSNHYTTAFHTDSRQPSADKDAELGIPLQGIRVRDEVDVRT